MQSCRAQLSGLTRTQAVVARDGPLFLAGISGIIGGVWLVLWSSGLPQRWVGSPGITMKTNMALSLVLAAAALVALTRRESRRSLAFLGSALAVVVFAVGALTGLEHIFHVSFGIDQVLRSEPPGATGTMAPNRMGPPGATCLTLIGAALLFLAWRRRAVVPYLGIAICLVSTLPALGYVYGIPSLYQRPSLTGTAWSTVPALMVLGLGLIVAVPERCPMALLLRDDPGGVLLRRMLPVALFLPIALGYLRTLGEAAGYYGPVMGRAFLVISFVSVFSALLFVSAARLSRSAKAELDGRRALRESEARFHSIFECAGVGICQLDPSGRFVSVNERACEILGYKRDEILGMSVNEVTAPEDRSRSERLNAQLRDGRISRFENEKRYLKHDGTPVWVRVTSSALRDKAGTLLSVITTVEDISKRKKAEESLRASEEKFRAVFQGAAVGIGRVCFSSACWIDANDALCSMVGYSPEEMRTTPWTAITHPDDLDLDLIPFRRMMAGELDTYTVEKRFIHKQGHTVWARLTLSLARDAGGRPDYEIAVVENTTEQKRAEEELRHRTAELESLLSNAPVGLAFFDREHRYVRINEKLVEINGIPAEAHLGKPISEVLPVNARVVDPILDAVFRTGRTIEREIAGETPKEPGATRHWLTAFYPVFDNGPLPVVAGAYAVEITDRKRAEEELRKSEERFQLVVRATHDVVWDWNLTTGALWCSASISELFGYDPAQAEQNLEWWAERMHPQDRERVVAGIHAAIDSGEDFWRAEYRFRRAGGDYAEVLDRGYIVHDELGKARRMLGTVQDMTMRKRAQEALIRSEKLASVGRMAASVAHEINNPLAMVLNSVFIALMDESLSARARMSLETAEKELERVAHLTRQTLGFYRENTAPTDVDVAALANDVVELYAPKFIRYDIRLESEHTPGLRVHAIAGELRQVVSNLITNAIDASAHGSRIRIRSSRLRLHTGERSYVRLTIADTGTGIDADHLSRIFEPFFTTKEAIGTGLGLWITSEIVRRHDGRIRVRSQKGKGTVFTVLLPEEPAQSGDAQKEGGVLEYAP